MATPSDVKLPDGNCASTSSTAEAPVASEQNTPKSELSPISTPTVGGSSLAARRNLRNLDLASSKPSGASAEDAQSDRRIRRLVPPESLEELYIFQEELLNSAPESGHCKVMTGKDRMSGKDVIIKIRSKRFAAGSEYVWRSVLERMLNLDDHTHVLGLQTVCEDDARYYVVMERCSGGELFDFLQTETDVPERECKRIMREILQAVDHLHYQGLIHRDIKPENIMFHDLSKNPVTPGHKKAIKLIDFDTCQEYEPMSPKAKHVVGTMGYIAPEALKGDYSPASDLWSVGVILYILMTGDMPFDVDALIDTGKLSDTHVGSANMEQLYERLKGYEIDFECEPWPSFPQACDLCRKLLAFEPDCRSPSAKDALRHPWLS